METKHTKGEWLRSRNIIGTPTRTICAIHGHQGEPETEANARLIAAAPDLLEALQTITQAVEDTDADGLSRLDYIARTAHAAVAKAKGDELCG